ncbi:dihydroorotase [Actinokineospora enzanensis]|uniref:dihydroorotase n=1 Tax=Actinokineospora enzanensis TaxID=155975 RepID=UPI00036EF586|nr:dihydroorotase family protein [Actinokineospora enzanensis]
MDLIITNARLVTPDGVRPGGIAVQDGRIARLLPPDVTVPATQTIDAEGKYALPGLIDSHVHFRTPGLTHKEDWAHAGRAAAAGGVTTVIDMPNTRPALHRVEQAYEKAELIEGNSLVDYRFHFGVVAETVSELESLPPRVATSVKVFMTGHHTAPDVVRDPAVLERIFITAAARDLRVILHAEDDAIFSLLDLGTTAPTTYTDYEPRRPRSAAIVAVAKVIELARRHNTSTHVLHVSSAEEAHLLTAARAAGIPITFETTPHHLSFVAEDAARLGARIRLSPAIRQPHDRGTLWSALVAGHIATIGSDHAPHTLEEKSRPVPDAPPGLPGVQELLPAVFTGLRRRYPDTPIDDHLSLLSRVAAAEPARLFHIDHRKGSLAEGKDADIVLFDPHDTWPLTTPHTKSAWSAYEGWTFTGRPHLTLRRGTPIHTLATNTFGPPTGEWLPARP